MNRYRFAILATLAAGLVGGLALAVSRAGQAPANAPQDRVSELLQRIEKLETRVAELEQRVPRVIVPAQGGPQLRVMPEVSVGAKGLPKGWVPRHFNGITYYDVPLEATPAPK
jgi:hypothetical protein